MLTNKVKIFIAIFILLILGAYFIWVLFFKTPETPEPTLEEKFAQLPESDVRIPSFQQPIVSEKFSSPETPIYEPEEVEEFFEIPILPIPKPDIKTLFQETTLPSWTAPFFENIQEAVEIVEAKIGQEEREIIMPSETVSNPISLIDIATTSIEILVPMTDEEFSYLYPEEFIVSLMDAQNLIKEYDPNYEIISEINTDAQVRLVEEQIIKALFSANMITKKEAETYITTIHFTLPQLQIIELKYYKLSSLLPKPKGLFFAGLIEKLQYAFTPKAQAGGPCGFCFVLPECYQVGAVSPTPGFNTFKAFCYCTGCLFGQGCLDFCFGRAAIWDPTTGICGCG